MALQQYADVLTLEQRKNYQDAIKAGEVTWRQLGEIVTEKRRIREANRRQARTVAQSYGLPQGFVDKFINSFIDNGGQVQVALADLREDPDYDRYFPGNKLEDGRVRYSESEYLVVRDSYADVLSSYGLNPDAYEDNFGRLIEGEVAPDELNQRINALWSRAVNAPEDVRRAYAAEFGAEDLSPESILAISLDTGIADAVRERRMDIAELTGQSKRYGFNRSRGRASTLLDSGLSAQQAQQFYAGAAQQLPRLAGSAATTGELAGIGLLEDAVTGDADAMATARRLSAQESSRFSRSGTVTSDRTGALRGLDTR